MSFYDPPNLIYVLTALMLGLWIQRSVQSVVNKYAFILIGLGQQGEQNVSKCSVEEPSRALIQFGSYQR